VSDLGTGLAVSTSGLGSVRLEPAAAFQGCQFFFLVLLFELVVLLLQELSELCELLLLLLLHDVVLDAKLNDRAVCEREGVDVVVALHEGGSGKQGCRRLWQDDNVRLAVVVNGGLILRFNSINTVKTYNFKMRVFLFRKSFWNTYLTVSKMFNFYNALEYLYQMP